MTGTTTGTTTAVLLAAGAGTRLGRGPKALLPYRGTTLVQYLAAVLREGGCVDVVVVLGAGAARVRSAADLSRYRVVDNPSWAQGLSTSFAAGIVAAGTGPTGAGAAGIVAAGTGPTGAGAAGTGPAGTGTARNRNGTERGGDILIALVDQPGLTSATVARLLAAHRPGRITAAGYRDADGALVRNHPLIFDAAMARRAADSAEGDAGARVLLRAHPGLIDLVDCSGHGDGHDVDTVEDLPLLDREPGRH